MPYAQVGGVELYFEEQGAGPVLVVAHGALGSVATTPRSGLHPVDIAARGVRVISYDARGHGRSSFTPFPEDYRRETRAADLLGLMDALGIARASIVGSSMGASTALTVALHQPARVSRLLLRAPSPFSADLAVAQWTLASLALSYQCFGVALTARLAALGSNRRSAERLRAFLAGQRREAAVPALRGVLSEPLYPDRLAEIRAPTLILSHPNDALHPVQSGAILRERLVQSQLVVATRRTYWEENPGPLNELIAAFVKGETIESEADTGRLYRSS